MIKLVDARQTKGNPILEVRRTEIGEAGSSLQVLVSFDIIFLVVCAIVFEYVLVE